MKIGSLFSGAGGLDRAVTEVFGGKVAWHSEVDAAASKVLAHRFPDVPNLGDVTAIDWDTVTPVDVMCGGYPCQPFSAAGQRKGTEDERHLWPYFAEAIRRVRPRFVVLENVAGHRSMGFGSVLGDLAEAGYDAQWCSVRASDVGAPHRRERIFVLATDTSRDGRDEGWPESAGFVGGSDAAVGRHGPVDLLPTPEAKNAHAGPDYARMQREGSGGHDLVTAIAYHDVDAARWGKYGPAIQRWESLTRPAPAPTVPNTKGNPRLSAAFAEWMQGWPAGWCTDPAIGIGRNDMLRIIGNGVCPPQAVAAVQQLLGFVGYGQVAS